MISPVGIIVQDGYDGRVNFNRVCLLLYNFKFEMKRKYLFYQNENTTGYLDNSGPNNSISLILINTPCLF